MPMKPSRRDWIRTGLHVAAAPAMMIPQAKAYDIEEIDAKIARGSGIEGVSKADLPTPSLLLDLLKPTLAVCPGMLLLLA